MLSPWDIELRLWLEGAEAFQEFMAVDGLMAFGATGILPNSDIVATLRGTPRWSNVTFSEQFQARPIQSVSVLAYRVMAEREGKALYEALCTSTYVLIDEHWWIIQHQQTPVETARN